MSDCHFDPLGRPLCQIVEHPDRPEKEKFCIYCKKRFVEKSPENSGWLLLILVVFVLLVLLLSSCKKQADLLLIRIVDTSSSALNDRAQNQFRKDACFGLADAAKTGDKQAVIQVNQDTIATDAALIKERSKMYGLCHHNPQPKGQGTYVCPALELAGELSDRSPNSPPFVLLQIQANEGEQFCPQTWQQLAQKITSRQGQLVIVGSTNDGNTKFNSQIWQTLRTLPNTKFCSAEVRQCIKESLQSIRN